MKNQKMKALMCDPRPNFEVGWEDSSLNAWMDKDFQPDLELAFWQWREFKNLLEKWGVRIYFLPAQPGLSDQVYVANVAWNVESENENVFIMANFAPNIRKPEANIMAEWLINNRFEVLGGDLCLKFLPNHIIFEGQGNMITTGDAYLYCHGKRNSEEAWKEINRTLKLKKPIIPLQLTLDQKQNYFYDGDLALRYFPHCNGIMYCPSAFDEESIEKIERLNASKFHVSRDFAFQDLGRKGRNFTLNGVYINNIVTFPWADRKKFPKDVRNWLEVNGGEVILHDFSQFGITGGGHNCVVNFLTRFVP